MIGVSLLIVLQLACNFEPVWCRIKILIKNPGVFVHVCIGVCIYVLLCVCECVHISRPLLLDVPVFDSMLLICTHLDIVQVAN